MQTWYNVSLVEFRRARNCVNIADSCLSWFAVACSAFGSIQCCLPLAEEEEAVEPGTERSSICTGLRKASGSRPVRRMEPEVAVPWLRGFPG